MVFILIITRGETSAVASVTALVSLEVRLSSVRCRQRLIVSSVASNTRDFVVINTHENTKRPERVNK
jgi:hypothetical protein